MESTVQKYKKISSELAKKLGEKNVLAAPRLAKVVVSTSFGKNREPKKVEFIADCLAKITGQKPAARGAKKSIASFKIRQGDVIGSAVTLRGQRMFGFLDKFLNAVVPRVRDFRGWTKTSVDEMGNLSVGIREHTVFPETADDELKDIFGLTVTIVTTAKNQEGALALFDALGFPFKRS